MQAIQAVLDLVKERDEITEELETYENWFESLVGEHVVLSVKSKKKTRGRSKISRKLAKKQSNIMDEKRLKRQEELEERQKRIKQRAGPANEEEASHDPLSRFGS
jgi:hypothetical protein